MQSVEVKRTTKIGREKLKRTKIYVVFCECLEKLIQEILTNIINVKVTVCLLV